MILYKNIFAKVTTSLFIGGAFIFVYNYLYSWEVYFDIVLLFALIYSTFIFLYIGLSGFYLDVRDDTITVRNVVFVWVKHIFQVKDLKEVFVGGGREAGTFIEIATKADKVFKYSIDGSKEDNKRLKDYLEKFKIAFGSDIFYI